MQPICILGVIGSVLLASTILLAILWRAEAYLLQQEKKLTRWLERRLTNEHKAALETWKLYRSINSDLPE